MSISSRQRMILDVLLGEEQEITIKEIADEIDVSTRTVHRELDEIEPLLEKHHLKLVKRAGVGIQIEGDSDHKEKLRISLINLTTLDFTAYERKNLIRCMLLGSTEPIKLVSLAYDLKVTPATISHDLDELEDWIRKYDLTLIRRRGYGIELQGTESAKRRAMSSLISENLNEYELIGLIKDNIQAKSSRNINSVSERLLGLIEKEKLIKVENALRTLEKDLPYPLADSAFIGLVIHLALAIERIKKGEKICFDEDHLMEIKDTQEYHVAARILERLKEIFEIDIPVAEIGYITMHLRGAKQRISHEDLLNPGSAELMVKVNQLIRHCEEALNVNFENDPSFLQGLLTHIEPAIFRIKRNMKIRNPLLDQIQNNYEELFTAIEKAVKVVFPHLEIPQEEIGYLAMHFGAALERSQQKRWDYRALIVCSSGIGSSKILATRIEKEIPEITVSRNVSLFEVDQIPKENYDIIISTIPLPSDHHEYVLVSPLLNKEDIQKIKLAIRNVKELPPKKNLLYPVHAPSRKVVEKLKSLRSYFDYAIEILEGFEFQIVNILYENAENILQYLCHHLQQMQKIKDKDSVVHQLLEREKLSGIGIPNTGIALFHCRSNHLAKVSFSVHPLVKPIWIKSMEDEQMEVDHILLLLGPTEIEKEGLEVLSHISSLLIDRATIDILRAKNKQVMSGYLSGKLYEFCHRQMSQD